MNICLMMTLLMREKEDQLLLDVSGKLLEESLSKDVRQSLLAGRLQSDLMPHRYSLKLQEYMAAIFNEFSK